MERIRFKEPFKIDDIKWYEIDKIIKNVISQYYKFKVKDKHSQTKGELK